METAPWQNRDVDHRDLAAHLLSRARALGADAADVLVGEGTDFSVTVRKGEIRFWGVRITVDTGQAAHSYEGMALVDAFRKWHKLVHVLEVQ